MKIPVGDYYRLLARYLAPLRRQMVLLALLLAASLAIQLYNPQILRRFLDQVQAGSRSNLLAIAGWFFLLGVLEQLMSLAVTYVGNDVAWQATNKLRQTLFDHILKLNLDYHQKHSPGELIERIDGDINALRHFFSNFVLLLLANLFLLIGILVMLFRENFWVGLLFSFFAALALWIIARLRQATTQYWQDQREASSQYYGFVAEHLSGLDDIRANGAIAYSQWRSLAAERQHYKSGVRARVTAAAIMSGMGGVIATGQTAALALAAALFLQNQFTIGTVYLVTYYIALIIRPIRVLVFQVDDLQRAGASIRRVQELLAEPIATISDVGIEGVMVSKPAGPLPLTFENVTFGYDRDNPILHNISFQLEAGEQLGILGRTGSGKSTLARLLFGFYRPISGQIRVGGRALGHLPEETWRQQIGLVTQQVDLFAASVRQNLTFFQESFTDEQLEGLIQQLGLADWLATQPAGLETMLPAGGGMSAGEAQLLALARIFLQDPNIIVLDEASSRLDPATEQKIEQVIDSLLHNRTGLIIAHKLETIRRCDKILILEAGHLVEFGDQKRLRAQPDSRLNQLLNQEQFLTSPAVQ